MHGFRARSTDTTLEEPNVGLYFAVMPTLHREGGFSVRMYPNDHRPPHVHVLNADGMARIALGDSRTAPSVISNSGMRDADVRRAYGIVAGRQAQLIAAWETMHGT
jgi:hypothetical protein